MVLVLFFSLLIALILSLIFSTLRINVEKIEISNEIENAPIVKECKIFIGIYFLNKILLFKKHLNKDVFKKFKNSKGKTSLDNGIEIIKMLRPKLKTINLKVELGTEDVVLTAFLICIISIATSIVLAKTIVKYNKELHKYEILPKYNENYIKIGLNSIITIKLVNIISVIFKLKFRSGKFGKRASYRKAYDDSYE